MVEKAVSHVTEREKESVGSLKGLTDRRLLGKRGRGGERVGLELGGLGVGDWASFGAPLYRQRQHRTRSML